MRLDKLGKRLQVTHAPRRVARTKILIEGGIARCRVPAILPERA